MPQEPKESGMTNLKSRYFSGAMLRCFLALSLCGSLPSAQANPNGDFLWAVGNGNEKEVARLLSKGADVNTRDEYGYAPLHFANKGGAKLLIANGADINAKDLYGRTPLKGSQTQLILAECGVGSDSAWIVD